MHDIVGTMFNKRFMEELFKPQDTYSKKAMRTVFDRLAHASIMRLNSASMDKVRASIIIVCLEYELHLLSFVTYHVVKFLRVLIFAVFPQSAKKSTWQIMKK